MKNLILLSLLLLQADFFEAKIYTYYLEFKTAPTVAELENLKDTYPIENISKFYNRSGDYWQRYYEVSSLDAALDTSLKDNSLFARVEKPVAAQVLSLEPSATQNPPSADTFIRYQWALENSGQKVYRSTDDIHPDVITSKVGLDVEWKALQPLLKKDLRRPVIAVVDSGLSYSHEEIGHAIAKNDIECNNGNRIIGAEEDRDGNGFAGDCMGWNFTTDNKQRRNDVIDDIGHGSHISGIIAAKTDDVGVSGLWDQIQILPLKVYNNVSESDEAPFIQRVAKAILYATDRKVDVINLSLGWPLISDLPVVRNAINEALKANIIVVAGAGNDGHSAKVLPCSYEGVICVGATALDGSLPDFTNYGGQVDILAPGEYILSIYPPAKISRMFGLRKYEVMNGTSQATPYVSATAAILKAYYPNIGRDEILARLRLSANSKDLEWGSKFAGAGSLQSASSINVSSQAYVAPVFKNLDLFLVNTETSSANFQLPIKNYWKASGPVRVRVSGEGLNLQQSEFNLSSLAEGQNQVLNISAKLPDLSSDYTAKLTVEVTTNGKTSVFTHEGFFSVDPNKVKFRDFLVKTKLPIQSVNDYEVEDTNAEFFTTEVTTEGLKLQVLQVNTQSVEPKASFFIPKATSLYPYVGVTRLDLNYDGKLDYFITAVIKNGEELSIEHYVLDAQLKPLFGNLSTWKFKDEGLLIHQPSLQFAAFSSEKFGKIRVPVFSSDGPTPNLDQNPDPFEPYKLNGRGIFVLQPVVEGNAVSLKTRLLNNYARIDSLAKRFSLRFNEDTKLLYYDIVNENIRALFASGLASKQQYNFVEFSATDFSILNSRRLPIDNLDLRYQVPRKINDSTLAFFGIYRNNFAQLSLIDLDSGKVTTRDVDSGAIKNGVISLLAVNVKADVVEAFVESVDSLLLFTFSNKGETKESTPIYRFSYLPGKFFTDILIPLRFADNNTGIYVDSSNINSRNVHSWISDGNLRTPIKYSIQLPVECRALSPRKLEATDSDPSYLFLCKKNEAYTLRQIPLNN